MLLLFIVLSFFLLISLKVWKSAPAKGELCFDKLSKSGKVSLKSQLMGFSMSKSASIYLVGGYVVGFFLFLFLFLV